MKKNINNDSMKYKNDNIADNNYNDDSNCSNKSNKNYNNVKRQ